MKRKKFISIISVITLLMVLFFKSDINTLFNDSEDNNIAIVETKIDGINISVDPRVELMRVMELMSDGLNLTNLNLKYKKSIQAYFLKYKKHEAVEYFKHLNSEYGYYSSNYVCSIIHYSNKPFLKRINFKVPANFLFGFGNQENLEEFISKLEKFSSDTNFKKFYTGNKELYTRLVKQISNMIAGHKYVGHIENYFGDKRNSYNIIVAPMLHCGGFGPQLTSEDGKMDIYQIIGPQKFKDGMPVYDENYIPELVSHEFGHSFTDKNIKDNMARFNRFRKLFEPVKEKMIKLGYGDSVESFFEESILRAAVIRINNMYTKGYDYKKMISIEESDGFIYTGMLCDKLKTYEENREEYKTFKQFFPKIINLFEEELMKM